MNEYYAVVVLYNKKIQDSITIAHHYGYELPLAQEKKLSKNTLKPE